ncbi:nuclear distribution protein nudE homolog [Drosophila kikkawai]|uniref:Nuclear distribution protein nudE homolog n=1 Tax=Drosophila kikkawai TaxID=30033 RepID=A0A6P4J1J0_DROKI|nr:nuclear distribution protein nudE homolog [Drosophila kikkawai]
MNPLPMFGSVDDESQYWKLRSDKHLQELMELKTEYNEFLEQSRDMEIEMDATLAQNQKRLDELAIKATNYERENEMLLARLNSQSLEISKLENELAEVTKKFETLKIDFRALEQTNDDLEQAQRVAKESKAIADDLLFEQYEKYALLELEVEEKQELEEELQRVKDEARDLKDELKTSQLKKASNSVTVGSQTGGLGDGSNFPFMIHKTVSDMVNKLDNLQTKLRNHREERPLPMPDF